MSSWLSDERAWPFGQLKDCWRLAAITGPYAAANDQIARLERQMRLRAGVRRHGGGRPGAVDGAAGVYRRLLRGAASEPQRGPGHHLARGHACVRVLPAACLEPPGAETHADDAPPAHSKLFGQHGRLVGHGGAPVAQPRRESARGGLWPVGRHVPLRHALVQQVSGTFRADRRAAALGHHPGALGGREHLPLQPHHHRRRGVAVRAARHHLDGDDLSPAQEPATGGRGSGRPTGGGRERQQGQVGFSGHDEPRAAHAAERRIGPGPCPDRYVAGPQAKEPPAGDHALRRRADDDSQRYPRPDEDRGRLHGDRRRPHRHPHLGRGRSRPVCTGCIGQGPAPLPGHRRRRPPLGVGRSLAGQAGGDEPRLQRR